MATITPFPQAPPEAQVSKRCPYCRDGLDSERAVLCATCTTPHHQECFSEHGSCAIRGCESTRSLSLDDPSQLRICDACSGQSPCDAPLCAWCGAALGPRGVRPPGALPRYLRAAALLLVSACFMGGGFGYQQAENARFMVWEQSQTLRARDLSEVKALLQELARAQRLFQREDLDGNGQADLAPNLAALRQAVRPHVARWGLRKDFWLEQKPLVVGYTLHVLPGGQGFEARPDPSWDLRLPYPRLTIDLAGRIREDAR